MKNKIEERLVRYEFSEEEKLEIGQRLAGAVAAVARLEDQKKSFMSQIKSEIDSKSLQVNADSERLRSGYEMRYVECEVVNAYIDRMVRWIRLDTGETAFERPMKSNEMQMKVDEAIEQAANEIEA